MAEQVYFHTVQYYETDRMGVTHHSNYIRWMEEARVALLGAMGADYREMEEQGVLSPVVRVECDFKKPTTFGDRVGIRLKIAAFTGIRLTLGYEMFRESDGETVCTATSGHCFMDPSGKLLNLRRSRPELFEVLKAVESV